MAEFRRKIIDYGVLFAGITIGVLIFSGPRVNAGFVRAATAASSNCKRKRSPRRERRPFRRVEEEAFPVVAVAADLESHRSSERPGGSRPCQRPSPAAPTPSDVSPMQVHCYKWCRKAIRFRRNAVRIP